MYVNTIVKLRYIKNLRKLQEHETSFVILEKVEKK